jgi:EAL domain-containing protein (putative c-di-GMP-specific phosphodiesterase class I)
MFKYAEICIRLSKKKGRHIVMYYSDIAGSVEARNVKIECEMLGAIKNGEFKVVYQPKINADDNTLLGTEALIRWHNSTLGDIEPREFIPLAEENGVIIEMGYWIIEKCITQNLEWGACGYDMKPISVNLTKKQFLDPNLISAVAGLCSKYNYPTGLIEFETTESIFSADYPLAKKTAQALHELGISLTLDDFGTSFSNMIEITSMCINTLKLKRNFVRDIDSNLGKQEVVRTLYNLSKRFDLHLIAEGVETSREFNKITGIGIKSIQGFYYSRPLPPNEFEQYIGDRRF